MSRNTNVSTLSYLQTWKNIPKLPVNVIFLINKKSSPSKQLPADWLPSCNGQLEQKEKLCVRSSEKLTSHSDAENKKQAEKGESAIRGPMNEVLDHVMTLDIGSIVESWEKNLRYFSQIS